MMFGRALPDGCSTCAMSKVYCDAVRDWRYNPEPEPCCMSCNHRGSE